MITQVETEQGVNRFPLLSFHLFYYFCLFGVVIYSRETLVTSDEMVVYVWRHV